MSADIDARVQARGLVEKALSSRILAPIHAPTTAELSRTADTDRQTCSRQAARFEVAGNRNSSHRLAKGEGAKRRRRGARGVVEARSSEVWCGVARMTGVAMAAASEGAESAVRKRVIETLALVEKGRTKTCDERCVNVDAVAVSCFHDVHKRARVCARAGERKSSR